MNYEELLEWVKTLSTKSLIQYTSPKSLINNPINQIQMEAMKSELVNRRDEKINEILG